MAGQKGAKIMYDLERIWETVISIMLAAAGGLARLLHLKDNKKMKWGKILSELFISGFSGIMVLMLARASGISGDWIGVVSGMSGWIGPRILDYIANAAGKATGLDVDTKAPKDD
jgi:hypothetical protein